METNAPCHIVQACQNLPIEATEQHEDKEDLRRRRISFEAQLLHDVEMLTHSLALKER
jgi:hypothetical protein